MVQKYCHLLHKNLQLYLQIPRHDDLPQVCQEALYNNFVMTKIKQ